MDDKLTRHMKKLAEIGYLQASSQLKALEFSDYSAADKEIISQYLTDQQSMNLQLMHYELGKTNLS